MTADSGWRFVGAVPEGVPLLIGGLDVWTHRWAATRLQARVEDPRYRQPYNFTVYEITTGDTAGLARAREEYVAALKVDISNTGDGWYYEAKADQLLALGRRPQAVQCLRDLLERAKNVDDAMREKIRTRLDELGG